jgi:hypothetical protein
MSILVDTLKLNTPEIINLGTGVLQLTLMLHTIYSWKYRPSSQERLWRQWCTDPESCNYKLIFLYLFNNQFKQFIRIPYPAA